MKLFYQSYQDFDIVATDISPTRMFVLGALEALRGAVSTERHTILNDLATQIDCEPDALTFLFCDIVSDDDLAVPCFHTHLADK